MTFERVTINGDTVTMSRDDYFALWLLCVDMAKFGEYLDGVADEIFQGAVYKAFCEAYIRAFPDYRKANED